MFGKDAERITKFELNCVFLELQSLIVPANRFQHSRSLEEKLDFGDVDIVVEMQFATYAENSLFIKSKLKHLIIKSVDRRPIMHCLYFSPALKKQVHVDFIFAPEETFDSNLMYLDYSDFAGICGVFCRKLKFNYGTNGFFKVFVDKQNQHHHILLSRNLQDGLRILGYADCIEKYDKIKTLQDIIEFMLQSSLFDSDFLKIETSNHSDRKRSRANRSTAVKIRTDLVAANKHRTQLDDDFYLKTLFPEIYNDYLIECNKINSLRYTSPKFNGNFIL